MAKKVKVEGVLELKLDDKDVQKNLDSLKKITSELEIDSNINEIQKQIDDLKNIDSEVDFNTNIDEILKQLDDIEKTSSTLDIDADFSEIKKNLEEIKNSNVNLDVKAENLQHIKKELDSMKRTTIKAEVKVDRTEWDELKKEWADKYTISAVASVAGGVVGENQAEQFNELMTMLRERGLTKEQAQELIAVGREQGLKMDELKDVVMYSNKDTLKLLASNDENAKRMMALLAAAERSGQAGADDLARMASALEQSGYTDEEILKIMNAMVDEVQAGHTEIAEAVREHIPELQGSQLDAEEFASILLQMNLPSSEDVAYMGDTLADLATYSKLNGKNTEKLLDDIKNAQTPEELQEIANNTKMDYERINRLHEYLQRVDLNKGLENNTDKLDELIKVNQDQRGILERAFDSIESWLSENGVLQFGAEVGSALGGLIGAGGFVIQLIAADYLKDILKGKLKITDIELPDLSKLKNIELPKIKLPNVSGLSSLIDDFGRLASSVKYAGRAFGALGVMILPTMELMQGDLSGAIEWLVVGLGMLSSEVMALAGIFTIAAGEILHQFGLIEDNGFVVFESGVMALLAMLTSFIGFITGDWTVSMDLLRQSFEALGLSTEEATALAEQEIAKWQQFPQDIIEWFSELPVDIKNIFDDTYNTIKNTWNNLSKEAYTWGADFLQNLIDGIKSKITEYTNIINQLAQKAKDIVGHTTPKEGPMKDDDKWGQHFMQNIIGGIKKELPNLKRNIDATANLMSSANPSNIVPASTVPIRSSASYRYGDIHINVIGNSYNEQQLAQQIALILKKQRFR